jgi:hypothetical protein
MTCLPVQRNPPNSPRSNSWIVIPTRTASSTRGDSVTAGFTKTSDLPNSSPVVMLITCLRALRQTVRYTRLALREGQFPTLPVSTGLTPQVRSQSPDCSMTQGMRTCRRRIWQAARDGYTHERVKS